MISFKSSFQTFLTLSAVWISFTCAPPDPEGLRICNNAMKDTFGSINKPPLDCIKTAIKTLIYDWDVSNDDVKEYSRLFQDAIKFDDLEVPPEYCRRIAEGVFTGSGAIIIGFVKESEKELQKIEEKKKKCDDDLSEFAVEFDISYTSAYQRIVMNTSIYMHKQVTEETAKLYDYHKHCHLPGTYGHRYLEYICEVIELKDETMKNPKQFCQDKYGGRPTCNIL